MTAVTFKVELFVIIVNAWKPSTIITKSSYLDVAVILDPPLNSLLKRDYIKNKPPEKCFLSSFESIISTI